jgi:subtilisin family serine protease
MIVSKRSLGFAGNAETDDVPAPVLVGLAGSADAAGSDEAAAVLAVKSVTLSAPVGIAEPQLDAYTYGKTSVYGSNITAAWRYSSGAGVTVALVDDGFDPATTATFANFSSSQSALIGSSPTPGLGEPAGTAHGTETAGLIGASGFNNTPTGIAPNATIVGVKVDFSTATIATLAQAEQYAASASSVVNNSWGYTGYGEGEPTDPNFAVWYAAIQYAVAADRHGLGDVITVAAGNNRVNGNDLAVEPITADYRVIAVAAVDADGLVASYSDPGAALLVAAVGDNVAVADTGGKGNTTASGTSFAAPTVAGIVAMMLSVNPNLGWRDVQEILADSAYMPPPSAAGFTFNGATGWNGGGMHFSNDLGFGIMDANVAVNLARTWTEVSTSANLDVATVTPATSFTVGRNATVSSTVADTAAIRIQHVQVTINDTNLPVAWSKLVLVSPDGTKSVLLDQTGLIGGVDQTDGLDVSGLAITSNAFWGELATGIWTLQVEDIQGQTVGTVKSWSLTVIGDNAATVQTPLVYTPEFATLATAVREVVKPGAATTIDLIALPGTTTINLNGGAGMIDSVAVTVATGLKNANANGSLGSVTLTGVTKGGSELTGGDGVSTLTGSGGDTINAGLGSTTIKTGAGSSKVTLSDVGTSAVTITSGGGDTIYAGLASASITDTGSKGDTIYDQSAQLSFINGTGASVLDEGSGSVTVQAGIGGGTYYAGTGGGSHLTAGTGIVTFYGEATGDVLTASGAGADRLIAGGGTETLSGGSSTGSITLQAGSGTDTMTAGKGKTTFILGTGASTITLGGTSDVIEFQSGAAGGLDTVSGFKLGLADLEMVNFGPLAMSSAINAQKSDGHGGTMLTFTDNTRIDLLGINKVTSNYFT